jgi:hypothetical protein
LQKFGERDVVEELWEKKLALIVEKNAMKNVLKNVRLMVKNAITKIVIVEIARSVKACST